MINCPKCNREFKTESRMKNHIEKCRGKCPQCQNPIIKGIKFCSRFCYDEFVKQNPEYRKEITKKANEKSRELGSKGLHWCQINDEKAKKQHEKWFKASHKKLREMAKTGEIWTQKDKDKLSEAMIKIHTKEAHEKVSQKLQGRKFSDSHKQNISKVRIQKGLARGKNNPMYGKSPKTCRGYKGGYREDLGHRIRSSWEANFARILKYENKTYLYEEIFEVTNKDGVCLTYRPDFYCKNENKYFEVKGYWWDDAKLKFDLFKEQYPEINIELIDAEKYKELENKYKHIIKEWE